MRQSIGSGVAGQKVLILLFAVCFAFANRLECLAEKAAKPVTVDVPGTSVSMRQPAGFFLSKNFSGFQNANTGASIMVTEIPGPYKEVSGGFTDERLKPRGMTLLSRANARIAGYDGILANISQKAYGMDFLKWIAVFGTGKRTVLITATYKADTKEAEALDLRDCLANAKWREKIVKNPEEHLTYSIEPVEPFKLATGIQNALLFTVGGTFPQKSPDQPVFIAAEGLRPVAADQQESFAKSIVASTAKMKDFEQISFVGLEVNGLKGFESTSLATDTTNGGKMFVHQVILYTKDGYYRCQGIVSEKGQEKYRSAFEKMARTLKRKS